MAKDNLPTFLQDPKVAEILKGVVDAIPQNVEVYLYGGAARNAVFFQYHQKPFPQRDYDIILIGDREPFIQTLVSRGFRFGKKNGDIEIVLKKPKVENPTDTFKDWLFLDIRIRHNMSIVDVIQNKANFVMNGFALNLRDIFSPDWFSRIVAIPGAFEDIKNMKLRLNKRYDINIYACIRFVSQGFAPPSKEEITMMLEDVYLLDESRFLRDRQKVIDYVGSEEKVREIIRSLGITLDILDYSAIKSGI